MNKIFIYPLILLALVLAGAYFFSACEKEDDTNEFPVTIESVVVDYIGANGAWTLTDIIGDVKKITEMGICYSLTNPPTITHNKITFEIEEGFHPAALNGLQSGQTYYLRAFAIHLDRIVYSPLITFTTTIPVADIDGNNYPVVKIGNQFWMAENLKTESYRNGEPIESGNGKGNYSATPTPRYFFHYLDNTANKAIYGNLYTWYAATDTRGICPVQWSIPDVADWETLIGHLDALAGKYNPNVSGVQVISAVAGGMLRTKGTIESSTGLWRAPNNGATNETSMSMLPSGLRDPSGAFDGLGLNAGFWSFTERDLNRALMFYTHYFNPGIHTNSFSKASGYAVRCVRKAN